MEHENKASFIGVYHIVAAAYHFHFYHKFSWHHSPPLLEDFDLTLTWELNIAFMGVLVLVGMWYLTRFKYSDVVLLLTTFLWVARLVALQPLYVELSLHIADIAMGCITAAALFPLMELMSMDAPTTDDAVPRVIEVVSKKKTE